MSGELRKSAFGGFKRKEVLDYIEQLNMRANEKETQLNEKLTKVAEAIKILEEEAVSSKEKLSSAEALLKEKTEQAQTLAEENKVLAQTLVDTQAEVEKLSQKETELEAMQKENERLSAELKEKNSNIEKIQSEFGKLTARADETAEKLSAKEAELYAAQKENENLAERLKSEKAYREKAQAAVDELTAQADTVTKKLDKKEVEFFSMREECERLTALLKEKENNQEPTKPNEAEKTMAQEIEDKSEKYDEVSHQLGRVFMDAHERADLMLNNALSEVHSLAENTNASAKELMGDFISLKDNVFQIHACVNRTVDVINLQLADLNKEIETAIKRLENGIAMPQEKPESAVELPDFIEKAMDDSRNNQIAKKNVVPVVKRGLFDSLIRRDKRQ